MKSVLSVCCSLDKNPHVRSESMPYSVYHQGILIRENASKVSIRSPTGDTCCMK